MAVKPPEDIKIKATLKSVSGTKGSTASGATGKLRRGRRRLICRIIGHDWGGWEPNGLDARYIRPQRHEFRECQRCPRMEWR